MPKRRRRRRGNQEKIRINVEDFLKAIFQKEKKIKRMKYTNIHTYMNSMKRHNNKDKDS